jgi:hypothetical protein
MAHHAGPAVPEYDLTAGTTLARVPVVS